jgi:hypothetical protein
MDQSKLPQPTELVYSPRPTAKPALLATGLVLIMFGLFDGWFYAAFGAVLAIAALISWIRDSEDEVAGLPREQHPRSAALPLTAVQRPRSN